MPPIRSNTVVTDEQESVSLLRIDLEQVDVYEYVKRDDLLGRSPLLQPLSERERAELLHGSRTTSAGAAQIILPEGQSADAVWLILEGAVSLALGGGVTDLGMLGKGDFFGLSAVEPRAVRPRARAESAVRLARLQPEQIALLRQLVPELAQVIAQVMDTRNRLADAGDDFMDRW